MKVISLSLHGPDPSIEEEEPVVNFVRLTATGGIGDLVLDFIVLLDEILHDAAGLKEADRLAIGEGVCKSGNAAVWIDLEKPWLFLGVGLDVDFVDFIGETADRDVYSAVNSWVEEANLGCLPKLFKGNRNLNAVRSLGCVEVDVRSFGGGRHGVGEMFGQLSDTMKHG